jgi:hypothetical protein
MITLGNRFMERRFLRDVVAFQHQHLLEVVRQHARGHQAGDATANHDSALTQGLHRVPPYWLVLAGQEFY